MPNNPMQVTCDGKALLSFMKKISVKVISNKKSTTPSVKVRRVMCNFINSLIRQEAQFISIDEPIYIGTLGEVSIIAKENNYLKAVKFLSKSHGYLIERIIFQIVLFNMLT